ncbi:MAG: hypothetical protein AB7T63_17665 [Planctomycetota bacterium]
MESRRPDPAARSCRLLGGGALLAALALGAAAPCAQAAEAPTRPFVVEGEALVRGARASEGTVKLESMRDHGDGWSGWAQLRWKPFGEGQTLGLVLVAPADGTYRVDAAWTRGPDAGDVRVSVRGRMFEPTLEGWSPRVDLAGPVRLGEVNLVRGANDVEIRVVGHDVRSNGYRFGLDRLVLTPLGASGAEPGAAEVATPVEPSPEAEGPTSEPPRPARTGPVAVPPPPVPPNPPGTAPPPGVATPGDDAPLPPGPLPGDPAGLEPLPTFDEGTPAESLPPPETMPPRPEPAAPDAPPPTPGERETPAAAPCGVMGQAAACDEETAPVVDPDAEVPVAEPPAGAADVPPAAPPLHTAPAGTEPPAAPDVTAPEVVEPAAPTPATGPTPPAPGPARAPQPSQPVGPPPRPAPAPAPAPDAGTTPAAPAPAPAPGPAEPEVAPKPPVEAPPPGPTPADRRLLFEAVQGLERYFEGKPRGAGWAKALKLAEVREAMAAKTPDDAVAAALARRLDKFPPGPAYEALLGEPGFVRLTRALAPFRTSGDDTDDWSSADR